jgi:serine protease AprX
LAGEPCISPEVVNLILFGAGERQRFTQDTPILPEVWQGYAAEPAKRQDLLITPMESAPAVAVLRAFRERMAPEAFRAAEPAPLQSFLSVRLSFDEIVSIVLPVTEWAQKSAEQFAKRRKDYPERQVDALDAFDLVYRTVGGTGAEATGGYDERGVPLLRGGLFETARILTLAGAIAVVNCEGEPITSLEALLPHRQEIADFITQLVTAISLRTKTQALVWRVARNRPLSTATAYSKATVKADAAYRLFDVRCEKITWAVIDSGIDRDHPAFRCAPDEDGNVSRVRRTYNLGILRRLLNASFAGMEADNPALQECIEATRLPPETAVAHLRNAYQSYETEVLDWSSIEPLIRMADPPLPTEGHGTHVAGIIGAGWYEDEETSADPAAPAKDILRPDKSKPIVVGLCPDIRLMDLRILGNGLEETEFAVIGALQLVRYLNSHNQYIVVHGVNLSLSIPHMVENYACGRTPVCDECERLVGAGVTVVAAAGNEGYHKYQVGAGRSLYSGYTLSSITDPGNAESVITVGATHRREPHTYGISYFSSRGPTGDGRVKPDLVAPGERILSTLPDKESGALDGTSQAAPHVSAAAAMLMARYPELNRDPRRIKQLLCESAMDLGRERSFQGHGLLDILRALQSF